MKKMIDFLRVRNMLSCILDLVISVASIKILPGGTSLQEGVVRMLLTATMAFFLYFISGEKTLQACDNETGYVLKVAAPMLIVSLLFGGISLIGSAFTLPFRQDWLFELLSTIYMCLFVGLFEELCFRAIINDALVYQFRNFKYVFVVSAIFSSIIFGYVHVLGITPDTPAILAQIIGKTVSTALFGFALLILYWKTRNIWACGLTHAIYDFVLMASDAIFESPVSAGGYVDTSESGVFVAVMYGFFVIVDLVIAIMIWKKVGKNIDFEEMRKNW